MEFSKAKPLIKEGDVLLFHAGGFLSIGWFITGVTRGQYSHVGIASWKTGQLTIIEQKEFKGGREVLLESQIFPWTKVDVYRARHVWTRAGLKEFSPEVAECVSQTARSITGKKYGWKNIWDIYKQYLPFYRYFVKRVSDDLEDADIFVCSTNVSNSYRVCFVDLVPNLSDKRTTPDDLARSPVLEFQFRIEGK